jgi:acetyl esterase/lipase
LTDQLLKTFLNFIMMGIKVLFHVIFSLFLTFSLSSIEAQTVMPLYAGEIPNSRNAADRENSRYERDSVLIVSKVSRPSLTIFFPPKEKTTGAAVIICPGGGYTNLAMGYEGTDVALRFNQSGISAFVLKYRIPDTSTMIHKQIGPLQDAQRAIQVLRSHAREWGINPARIGIMGFSAGGHLAATAGTHFQKDYIPNPLHISLRPDFLILIYPVISFRKPIAHMGSANNLTGPNPSPEDIKEFSNEEHVTDQTPPSFLVHAKDDNAVPYENSEWFAKACTIHHVPVEVYYYEKGGHGFGMTNKTNSQSWMDLCIGWLDKEHFLK